MSIARRDVRLSPEADSVVWAREMKLAQLPALPDTLRRLKTLVRNDSSYSQQVVDIVRHDPAVVFHLLQEAARSALNYRSSGPLNVATISQAVLNMGYQPMRSLLSRMEAIEAHSEQPAQLHYMQCALQAYHAAASAESLAKEQRRCDVRMVEEVFVATLLHRIGEMAFWHYENAYRDGLSRELSKGKMSDEAAQTDILGFRFDELSKRLAAQTKISECLSQSYDPELSKSDPIYAVKLGERFTKAVKEGWESEALDHVVNEAATFMTEDRAVTRAFLRNKHEEIMRDLQDFVEDVQMDLLFNLPQGMYEEVPVHDVDSAQPTPEDIDNDVVKKLLVAIRKQREPKKIMHALMKGVVGFSGADRVIILLFSENKDKLTPRFVINDESATMSFNVDLNDPTFLFLRYIINENHSTWICDQTALSYSQFAVNAFRKRAQSRSFFIGPLAMKKHRLGVIFADGCDPSSPLNHVGFQIFQQLLASANMALKQN